MTQIFIVFLLGIVYCSDYNIIINTFCSYNISVNQ